MEKLKGYGLDPKQLNVQRLMEFFPEAVTDGRVDFDVLRTLLGDSIEPSSERYSFQWIGKSQSIKNSLTPSTGTLLPGEGSVDGSSTNNLYIEGDNLEVLKILSKTYHGKVKMIYIDPPYNTGHDFVYKDDFVDSIKNYLEVSKQTTKTNPETSGRYHTDWLNMMYARLRLAKDLLAEDGAIFISIDDNEAYNLKKICDEIFGEYNFIGMFPWRKRTAKSDVPFGVSQDYEQVLAYAKSDLFVASTKGKQRKYYETDDFPGKPWRIHDLTKQTTAAERPNSFFTIVDPRTGKEYPANPNRTWAITKETFEEYYKAKRIVFPGDYPFLNISKPMLRYWKEDDMERAGDSFGMIAVSTKFPDDIGMSQDGTKQVTNLFGSKVFSFPKPVELIKFLISISTKSDDLIMDFFSGSATTAEAVMRLNAEDGGSRRYIMVQLPEVAEEGSEARKAGYLDLCEVAKARISKAAQVITAELEKRKQEAMLLSDKVVDPSSLDLGFKVFRLDSSNIIAWDGNKQYTEEEVMLFGKVIKDDRTDLDVAYEIMLKYGVFDKQLIEKQVNGKKMFSVDNDSMIICLADEITADDVMAIIKLKPSVAVFKEAGFKDDNEKMNADYTLKHYLGEGDIKVLCI